MMTVLEMAHLLYETRQPAKSLNRSTIPAKHGLYVWYCIASDEVFYVGKATGRGGLRRRVGGQHLNPKYVETRPERFRPKDEYQRSCAVSVGGKVCVDKSVLRRSLGRLFRIAPGKASVQYILDTLAVAWITAEHISDIPKCEAELIRELKPKLNVCGVHKTAHQTNSGEVQGKSGMALT